MIKIYLIILLSVIFSASAFSQLHIFTEAGGHGASEGLYNSYAVQATMPVCELSLSAGTLFSLSAAQQKIFSGLKLSAAYELTNTKYPIDIQLLYMYKPFSSLLSETNAAITGAVRFQRFGMLLDANTRIYSFTAKGASTLPQDASTHMWEYINTMYRFSYYVPLSTKTELETKITNVDEFIIQQETNPMVFAKISHQYNSKLNLYTELGYLQSGLMNIRVNYFGVFIRGGVIWQIQ